MQTKNIISSFFSILFIGVAPNKALHLYNSEDSLGGELLIFILGHTNMVL